MKRKQELTKLELQRKATTRQGTIFKKHQKDYRLIKEANEICQGMGKSIKFRPVLVKAGYD